MDLRAWTLVLGIIARRKTKYSPTIVLLYEKNGNPPLLKIKEP